jgi:hypothetical protein
MAKGDVEVPPARRHVKNQDGRIAETDSYGNDPRTCPADGVASRAPTSRNVLRVIIVPPQRTQGPIGIGRGLRSRVAQAEDRSSAASGGHPGDRRQARSTPPGPRDVLPCKSTGSGSVARRIGRAPASSASTPRGGGRRGLCPGLLTSATQARHASGWEPSSSASPTAHAAAAPLRRRGPLGHSDMGARPTSLAARPIPTHAAVRNAEPTW